MYVKSFPVDPEKFEKLAHKTVELAVKDTIAKMTRQELVNMMRSTMTTALNDYHNSSIMIERMKSGGC